jgi:hypothetical protein
MIGWMRLNTPGFEMSFRNLSELEAFFMFRREWKARDSVVVLSTSVLQNYGNPEIVPGHLPKFVANDLRGHVR